MFSKCFMNNSPMKTTKIQYKNRLPYIRSGLRNESNINIYIYAKNPTDENQQKCRKQEQDYIEEQPDLNKADMSKVIK